MSVVTVSSRFQVAIPRNVHEALELEPGQKVMMFAFNGRVELVPVRPATALRGFLRGIDSAVVRERDRK